jgi:iron complex transport system ATP-binding protein
MTLDLHAVTRTAGTKRLLDHITVTFPRGEVTAVVGPNGAGKSTLLRLASGIVAPSSGQVTLDGCPLARLGLRRLAERRAMLAQDVVTGARFAVLDLVAMGAAVSAPHLAARQRGDLARALLARLGLAAFADRDVTTLSGGERQRVHFARVLMQIEAPGHDLPGFLLLDEPLSAQDPAHQSLLLRASRDHAARGGGVIVVLHDLNWAAACADRIVVLHQGALHAQGTPRDVLTPGLLGTVFGLPRGPVHHHHATGKPYLLPHDIIHAGETPCTLP